MRFMIVVKATRDSEAGVMPEEADRLWQKLSEGGEQQQCGWLRDKYGVSWQIIPSGLGEILHDADPEGSKRAMKAMLQMKKIDIEKLKQAREQRQ